jgi:hypothetical protein
VLALGPAFEWAWGMGYRRSPLEARLGLPTEAPAREPRCGRRSTGSRRSRTPTPPTISSGWRAGGALVDARAFAAGSACVAEVDAYVSGRPAPLRLPATVRRLPAGTLLSGGFAGVQAPWWREPHVDGGLPPAAALATGLHELAHAAGWAGEAETDAIAVLAGLACDDPDVRFATALHGLQLVRASCGGCPRPRRGAGARRTLGDAAGGGDVAWAASADAVRAHRLAPVQRAAEATYDVYLRAHGIEAGMADYGRAAVLLVAALERCSDEAGAPWCAPVAPSGDAAATGAEAGQAPGSGRRGRGLARGPVARTGSPAPPRTRRRAGGRAGSPSRPPRPPP